MTRRLDRLGRLLSALSGLSLWPTLWPASPRARPVMPVGVSPASSCEGLDGETPMPSDGRRSAAGAESAERRRCPCHGLPHRGGAPGAALGQRPGPGAGGGCARRGGERLPVAGPARPPQPLRAPGHRVRLLPAELVRGARMLGPIGPTKLWGRPTCGFTPAVRMRPRSWRTCSASAARGTRRPRRSAPPWGPAHLHRIDAPERILDVSTLAPCHPPELSSCRVARTRWWSERLPGTTPRLTGGRRHNEALPALMWVGRALQR